MGDAVALFNQMRANPDNKLCFECSKVNPQWASVPFGIIVCLECAGTHRSLGVHLSFVRSLTMDSWNDKQLASMRAGGNSKCKEFFEKYNMPDNFSGLGEKYSSSIAQAYKAKIKALSEGQEWEDPNPEDVPRKFPAIPTNKSTFSLSKAAPEPGLERSGSSKSAIRVAPPGVGPSNPAQERLYADYGNSTSISNKDLFCSGSRGSSQNNQRPNYGQNSLGSSGSGNRNQPAQNYEDPWEYLSAGWNTVTSAASAATASVAEQLQNVDLTEVKANLASTSERGWGFASDLWGAASQYVGESVDSLSKMAQETWENANRDQPGGPGGGPPRAEDDYNDAPPPRRGNSQQGGYGTYGSGNRTQGYGSGYNSADSSKDNNNRLRNSDSDNITRQDSGRNTGNTGSPYGSGSDSLSKSGGVSRPDPQPSTSTPKPAEGDDWDTWEDSKAKKTPQVVSKGDLSIDWDSW